MCCGWDARRGTRTHTPLRATGLKSAASTVSATRARCPTRRELTTLEEKTLTVAGPGEHTTTRQTCPRHSRLGSLT
jgi:hypothetical protein